MSWKPEWAESGSARSVVAAWASSSVKWSAETTALTREFLLKVNNDIKNMNNFRKEIENLSSSLQFTSDTFDGSNNMMAELNRMDSFVWQLLTWRMLSGAKVPFAGPRTILKKDFAESNSYNPRRVCASHYYEDVGKVLGVQVDDGQVLRGTSASHPSKRTESQR